MVGETIIEKVRCESVSSNRSTNLKKMRKSMKKSISDSVLKIKNKVKISKKHKSDKRINEFAECHSKCEYCASIFVVMTPVDILKKKYRI